MGCFATPENRLRFYRVLFVLCCIACLPGNCRAQITLYRDKFGVPSIVADRLPDALYGLGYAMAQDNAVQMARNFKQARGRLAEVDGKGALLTDGFLHSLGLEALAEEKATHLSPEETSLYRSFCEGANRALTEQKSQLPDWIEPFTVTDMLAMAQLLNVAFPLEDIAGQLLPGTGSNQFAVAPKRSATGHAILSIDPHLPWTGPLAWYEFALYTKEFAFRGIMIPGLPFGVMGHSDRVAWCMTNNNPSLHAFFTVQTNPDNSKQYSYHGEWRDFEDASFELRYRENGQLKTRTQKVRRTAWGPMLPFRTQAVSLSPLGHWESLEETLQMARARDARQFREALRMRGLSMWNIMYADTQGNIGYQYNARLPKRDPGFDWSRPVPGNDPRTRWGDLWSLDDLPHLENPVGGLLVNCNSAPWLTAPGTEKVNTWPTYVTSYDHTTRYDRLSSLLLHDPHITLEAARKYATDTQVPYALKTVAALQQVVLNHKVESEMVPVLPVLFAWNGRADIASSGCALYYEWLRADPLCIRLAEKADAQTAWTASEQDTAMGALSKAIAEMKRLRENCDIPWGDIHIKQRGNASAPTSGFHFGATCSAVVPNYGPYHEGKISCSFGSSFRMIVDLDPKGIHSWSILPYGDSQDPNNSHYADEMAMHSRGEYKATYFGLGNAKHQAVMHITLNRSQP